MVSCSAQAWVWAGQWESVPVSMTAAHDMDGAGEGKPGKGAREARLGGGLHGTRRCGRSSRERAGGLASGSCHRRPNGSPRVGALLRGTAQTEDRFLNPGHAVAWADEALPKDRSAPADGR